MNKLVKILFSVWCIVLAFSSCVYEEYENNAGHLKPGGNIEVMMRLKTPGKFAPATRGMTVTQENNIDDICVLVFDQNSKLTDVKSGRDISDVGADPVSNERSFSVALATSGATEDTKLVVLANVSHIPFDREANIGNSYSAIMPLFTSTIDGAMFQDDNPVIPMWGETGYITISPSNNTFPLKLHRAIARIDVGLGTPVYDHVTGTYTWSNDLALPFELHEVILFKPNNAYKVAPDAVNFGPEKTHTPSPVGDKFSIDDSKSKFRFAGADIVDGYYTSQSVYIPEADVVMNGSGKSGDINHTERLAIIVGGKYKGSATVTFYRLDFQSRGNLMNVLRNHLYQFNIKSVSGGGYATPEDAYNSLAMNMSAEIIEWNDGEIGDVHFDGQYYFGIEKREVVFSSKGDETIVLKVRTNVPDWAMWKLDDPVLHATNSPTYRNETYGYDYKIEKTGDDTYTLTIKAEKPNVSSDSDLRKERFKIKAKRLEMDFMVEQEHLMSGGSADVLYFDASGTLRVGKYNIQATLANMAYFKFGSVVGFTNDGANWDHEQIIFNPTASVDYTNYSLIPSFSTEDFDGGLTTDGVISTAAYHNAENIKSGKGDPCKLVGLTDAQVKGMSAVDLNGYKSGWRLPTPSENSDFVKNNPNFRDVLPAGGYRFTNGAPDNFFTSGYYWLSTPESASKGYHLFYTINNVTPQSSNSFAFGFSVRCVRQD